MNADRWRPAAERRRVDALIAYLKTLDPYDLARYCELVLARHHSGIIVRPERMDEAS